MVLLLLISLTNSRFKSVGISLKYGFLYLLSKTMRIMLLVCKPSASKMLKSGSQFFFKI